MRLITRFFGLGQTIACLFLAGSICKNTHAAMFTGLGFPSGEHRSEASAISSDGSTVVGRTREENCCRWRPFRWTLSTGMERLGNISRAGANGISADGSVIVGSSVDAVVGGPVRWTDVTGWESLSHDGGAYDVSADGSVIVGDTAGRPFRWTESSGIVPLEGEDANVATAVSSDGNVVVGYTDQFSVLNQPFRWTKSGGLMKLGLVAGTKQAQATDVSGDGRVIVGRSECHDCGPITGFIWTEETGYTEITDESRHIIPDAVTGDGSVIVGNDVYWDAASGLRTIRDALVNDYGLGRELAGWKNLNARDITDDGRAIVGRGSNPDGRTEAWIAYLDSTTNPNPPTFPSTIAIPVTSADVSSSHELRSFVAGGVTYTQSDLLAPTLVEFAGNEEEDAFFATAASFPLPPPGSRAALLTGDFQLDTGVTQPSVSPDAATLAFSPPLVNGPGPDLVVFELDSTRVGDAFYVSVGEANHVVLESSWGTPVHLVDVDAYDRTESVPTTIEDLENGSFTLIATSMDHPVVGTAIDLTDLGIAPTAPVETINFGSFGSFASIDPVLFMGIRSTTVRDFDMNGILDVNDLDALVGEIVAGTNDLTFDVSRDGIIDDTDLSEWLAEAAAKNGFAEPYLLGDANLDGTVNAVDLNKLGQSWLSSPNAWQWGDFNADGIVDTGDLDELAQNWLMSIPAAASESVPEPAGISLLLMFASLLVVKPFRATR